MLYWKQGTSYDKKGLNHSLTACTVFFCSVDCQSYTKCFNITQWKTRQARRPEIHERCLQIPRIPNIVSFVQLLPACREVQGWSTCLDVLGKTCKSKQTPVNKNTYDILSNPTSHYRMDTKVTPIQEPHSHPINFLKAGKSVCFAKCMVLFFVIPV